MLPLGLTPQAHHLPPLRGFSKSLIAGSMEVGLPGAFGFSVPAIDGRLVEYDREALEELVLAYASVVDNHTGDATTMLAPIAPEGAGRHVQSSESSRVRRDRQKRRRRSRHAGDARDNTGRFCQRAFLAAAPMARRGTRRTSHPCRRRDNGREPHADR